MEYIAVQHPWVGKHYGEESNLFGGKKILVVGESHYGDSEDSIGLTVPGITKEVVEKHIDWSQRLSFFTRMVYHFTGVWGSQDHKHATEMWHHLAFYNYIPVIAASGPREFDWRLWERGEPEFKTVLGDLKPDAIVVLGHRLWENAYYRHGDGTVDRGDTQTLMVNTAFEDRLIPTMKTAHPSSTRSYKPQELYPLFTDMISAIG